MQPIYEFGGAGRVLHLAVANGFPPQTYKPLIWPLTGEYLALSLPPRALWPGQHPPDRLINWRDLVARDLIEGIRAYDLRDLIAIGHSFGAVASLLAAIEEPERFRALILLDPTIPPPMTMRMYDLNRLIRRDGRNGIANRAEQRRDRFSSVEEAFAYFRGKRLFHDWPDAALQLYAECLIEDGEGLTLAWPKAWEAYYFRTPYTGTWRDLPRLRGNVPLLVIRGGTSNTFQTAAAERMQRMLPGMAYAEISGHGHLFPHTAPDLARRIILDWLAGLA
jgi:pimeloyl-ACP methyl ester carboxylesterase